MVDVVDEGSVVVELGVLVLVVVVGVAPVVVVVGVVVVVVVVVVVGAGAVVVVVGAGAVVVVVGAGAVVVVVVVGGGGVTAVAEAMTGDMGGPGGLLGDIPSGALLLAYGVQVRLRGLPETTSVSFVVSSTSMLIDSPVAVNGPIVPAGLGTSSVRPAVGTGFGMERTKLVTLGEIDDGLAPMASTELWTVPLRVVLPKAAAADTNDAGIFTWV